MGDVKLTTKEYSFIEVSGYGQAMTIGGYLGYNKIFNGVSVGGFHQVAAGISAQSSVGFNTSFSDFQWTWNHGFGFAPPTGMPTVVTGGVMYNMDNTVSFNGGIGLNDYFEFGLNLQYGVKTVPATSLNSAIFWDYKIKQVEASNLLRVEKAKILQDYIMAREVPSFRNDMAQKYDLMPKEKCFPSSTPILTPSGYVPIESIQVGDFVLAYNTSEDNGRGKLTPQKVTRLYRNATTEWIKLNWTHDNQPQELITTPHHHFLDKNGSFLTIEDMLENNTTTLINADGNEITVTASRITYSEQTAHLFEQSASMSATVGNLALQTTFNSWQTYNFEVATHHTYVANNIRVHNYSGALGAVANTLDAALDRVMGAKDGDGSFRDAISDLATSPLHAAGHIVSGAAGAAISVATGIFSGIGKLLKGDVGGALGSLAAGVGGAVASVFGGIAA
jgi:hypothetical protein